MIATLRGGSWFYTPDDARASYRDHYDSESGSSEVGFRCAQRDRRPLVALRGGSWFSAPRLARASNGFNRPRAFRYGHVGFRCCIRR